MSSQLVLVSGTSGQSLCSLRKAFSDRMRADVIASRSPGFVGTEVTLQFLQKGFRYAPAPTWGHHLAASFELTERCSSRDPPLNYAAFAVPSVRRTRPTRGRRSTPANSRRASSSGRLSRMSLERALLTRPSRASTLLRTPLRPSSVDAPTCCFAVSKLMRQTSRSQHYNFTDAEKEMLIPALEGTRQILRAAQKVRGPSVHSAYAEVNALPRWWWKRPRSAITDHVSPSSGTLGQARRPDELVRRRSRL